MKRVFAFILPLSLWLVFACNSHEKTSPETKVAAVPVVLNPDWIFCSDSISAALERVSSAQKAEGRRHFMSGLDLFVNKNDPASSIGFFTKALTYYPDEKSYDFLFRAYLKTNNIKMAGSVNTAAVLLFEMASANFNSALICASRKDTANCISFLSEAILRGFASAEKITEEPLFDFIRDFHDYQLLMLNSFGTDAQVRKKLFAAYLKPFEEVTLPYIMHVDSAATFNYEKFIRYDFAPFMPGMEDERFSRMVSKEYMALARFNTHGGTAVLYKTIEVMGDTLMPVTTSIITYDSLGNVISNSVVACFCSPLERKSCVINADFSIEVTDYKVDWEKDPLESGYSGNTISAVTETGKKKFFITVKNEVVEATESIEAVVSSGQN